jgi:hypothetical protein
LAKSIPNVNIWQNLYLARVKGRIFKIKKGYQFANLQLSSQHPPSNFKKARSYMTLAMKNKVRITRIFLRDTGQWYFHIILEIIMELIA